MGGTLRRGTYAATRPVPEIYEILHVLQMQFHLICTRKQPGQHVLVMPQIVDRPYHGTKFPVAFIPFHILMSFLFLFYSLSLSLRSLTP